MGNDNSLELNSLSDVERIRDKLYYFYLSQKPEDPFISQILNLYYDRFVKQKSTNFRQKVLLLHNALNALYDKISNEKCPTLVDGVGSAIFSTVVFKA